MHFVNDSVTCTPEHPFFVDNDWVQAKELQVGDLLLNANGESVSVTSVLQYSTDTATTVYNLSAAGNHNYYVSASGVLVHNCGSVEKTLKFSTHAIERMSERGITEKMVKTAIEKGTKYWNPKNGTFNYVLENGFSSGKHLIVGQNSVSGYITTVVRQSKLPKGLIRIED